MSLRISGEQVVLRPATSADMPVVAGMRQDPRVARWWPPETFEEICVALLEEPAVTSLTIELDGEVIGLVQFGEESDPDYRHASVDIMIAGPWQGRGLGSDSLRTLAGFLFGTKGHHRITIDPAVGNERAIRCYESVGFRRVGVMRRYERGPDGTWRDGLLMDLLAEDLVVGGQPGLDPG